MGVAFLVIGERQPRVTLLAALVGVAGVVTLVWQGDRSGGSSTPSGWPPPWAPSCRRRSASRWSSAGHRPTTCSSRRPGSWSPAGSCCVPVAAVVEGAPPALDLPAVAGAGLPRPRRVGAGLRAVVPWAHPDGCRCRRRRRSGQPRRRHARSACCCSRSRSVRCTCARRRWSPSAACCVAQGPVRRSLTASAGAPGAGATAYRGLMPHVTTTDLTTPSGSVPIPSIGFGVWQVPDAEVDAAVSAALDAGYRHVDTARLYGNEAGVGRALASSDIAERRRVRHDEGLEQRPRTRHDAGRLRRVDGAPRARRARPVPHPLAGARAGTATSRPGRRCASCATTGGCARSGCATSTRRTCSGCSTRRGSGRASTRSSCTPTCSRRRCASSPRSTASSPSPGARSPRARGCSTTR